MNPRIHIHLPVADLDRSRTFYESFLGAPATRRLDDYVNFRLDRPGLHLALTPGTPAGHDSRSHFGVELDSAEELQAWSERATQAGLAPRTETGVTCCYAVADKIWVHDPDGHEWEVWVRERDVSNAGTTESECCATSGCDC